MKPGVLKEIKVEVKTAERRAKLAMKNYRAAHKVESKKEGRA